MDKSRQFCINVSNNSVNITIVGRLCTFEDIDYVRHSKGDHVSFSSYQIKKCKRTTRRIMI